MKSKRFLCSPGFWFAPVMIAVTCSNLHAADDTWTSTAISGNWSDVSNWASTTAYATGATNTATFSSNITATTTVTQDVPGLQIGNLIFSDNGASGSAWALGGTNGIALGDGTTTGSSTITTTTAATISAVLTGANGLTKAGTSTLTLSGANTYTGGTVLNTGTISASNSAAFGTGAITVSGNATLNSTTAPIANNITINSGITANFSGNGYSSKWSGIISGEGTVQSSSYTLLTGANTYTGGTVINGFLFGINSDASLGAVPASPVANNVAINGGTLSNYTGSYIDVTLSANRGILLGASGGSIDAGGNFIINGVISGTGNLSRATGGTVSLNGLNTYSGKTNATAGTTVFNTITNLADTSGSSFGAPTTVANGTIAIGSNTSACGIAYTGTGSTSDRVLNLNGTSGGATITQSGTGLLKFTSDLTATGVGSKTLGLAGATAGTGEIAGAIVDNTTTGTTTLAVAITTTPAATITLASVDGIAAGATITGTGITAGTTITAVNTSTKVATLSQNTNGTASSVGASYVITGVKNLTSVAKSGSGTWTLSGTNTYTGVTTARGSTTSGGSSATAFLKVAAIGNGGVAGNLGAATSAASNIVLGQSGSDAGQINYVGAGESTDRLFSVNGHGTIASSGTGPLVFSNPGTIVHVPNLNIPHIFTLGGTNTAANTFNPILADGAAGTGVISLVKADAGSWTLNGINTHTGGTTVKAGTLIASAPGTLGATTGALAVSGGTLNLNALTHTVGAVTFSGGITQNGSLNGISYASSGTTAATVSAVLTGSGTLTSAGVLTLSAANTYTGGSTLAGGTLTVGNATALNTGSLAVTANGNLANTVTFTNNIAINSGVTLGLTGGNFSRINGVISGSGSITSTASTVLGIANTYTGATTITGGFFCVGGDNSFGATPASFSANAITYTGGYISMFGSAASSVALNANRGITIASGTAGFDASAGQTLTVNGAITGAGNISHNSANNSTGGTLVLAGSNTYTGTTSVTKGTLAGTGSPASALNVLSPAILSPGVGIGTWSATSATFAAGSTFKVEINSTTAAADKLVASGAVNLGGTTLSLTDLGSATLAPGTKFTVIDYTGGSLTGTFAGLAEGSGLVSGSNTYVISYADASKVTLTVIAGGSYTAWAAVNAGGQAANLDYDHDGVPNGVEYFMGKTGTSFTPNPGPDANGVITWPKDPSAAATYVIEKSINLSTWTDVTADALDFGNLVTYQLPTGNQKYFVRLRVTVP